MNECLSCWSTTLVELTGIQASEDVSGSAHNRKAHFKAEWLKKFHCIQPTQQDLLHLITVKILWQHAEHKLTFPR